jgi:hypothetical protein
MKLFKSLGQKIRGFDYRGLGDKIYAGAKSLGQKVYDNRYKIAGGLLGLGLTAAGAAGASQYSKFKNKSDQVPMSSFPSVPTHNIHTGLPSYREALNYPGIEDM